MILVRCSICGCEIPGDLEREHRQLDEIDRQEERRLVEDAIPS